MGNSVSKATLYKKNPATSRVQVWSVRLELASDGVSGLITRGSWVYPNGKKKITKTNISKGTNVGRSNEKTPYENAKFKVSNMIKEKDEENYVTSLSDVDLPPKYTYACLAEGYREDKRSEEFCVQGKFNGVRVTKFNHLNDDRLLSRKLRDYKAIAHIKEALHEVFPPDISPDGEAYIHGLSLQGIASLTKKFHAIPSKPEHKGYCTTDLKFYLFDLAIPNMAFKDRIKLLNELVPNDHPILKVVPTFFCNTEEEYQYYKNSFIEQGFEGVMTRNPDSFYGFNDRNFDLMKDKDFVDSEFKIIDFTYEDWYDASSDTTKKLVIWVCETDSGLAFNSRPLGSFEQRAKDYLTGEEQIGKMLTVKYQDLSEDNVPNFNNGVCIRDYE